VNCYKLGDRLRGVSSEILRAILMKILLKCVTWRRRHHAPSKLPYSWHDATSQKSWTTKHAYVNFF